MQKTFYNQQKQQKDCNSKQDLLLRTFFGKSEHKVIYDDFKINDEYVTYNKHQQIANENVIAVKIGE